MKSFVIGFSWKRGQMKTNIVINISPLFQNLVIFCFSSYEPEYCLEIKLHDSLKCNISRKKRISTEVFYKLILPFWVCVARHAQSIQKEKFTYLCNSPRNGGNEVNFLATDKYKNVLQIDSITLGVRSLPFPKTLSNKFAISL